MRAEADVKLRQALGMARAAERLLDRAFGAQVLARGWQPGRPLPERLRRIQDAHRRLRAAREVLEQAVQLPPAAPSPSDAAGRRERGGGR
ncbi:MAG TPA: hypothetical protein VFD01_22300 [Candidatus Dormibacteraeota bacterium]|nr:hypothetical protein [Candidatus Dormibacteraeota bacterium]